MTCTCICTCNMHMHNMLKQQCTCTCHAPAHAMHMPCTCTCTCHAHAHAHAMHMHMHMQHALCTMLHMCMCMCMCICVQCACSVESVCMRRTSVCMRYAFSVHVHVGCMQRQQCVCSATATTSRSLPRASIRAAVRVPWQLCSAAEEESRWRRRRRRPPAAAAAACACDRHASRLSRSLAGWRCLAACAAAARTRQSVRRMPPRRWRGGIPSMLWARATPLLRTLAVQQFVKQQNLLARVVGLPPLTRRNHPHNCGAAPKSGHAFTARGNRVPDAVAAPPARVNRTRSPPAWFIQTRGPRPVGWSIHACGGRGSRVNRAPSRGTASGSRAPARVNLVPACCNRTR
jgi:hypothetical protein